LPSVQTTYSEKGKTPILRDACKYTHLSIASGISEDGDIIYQVRQNSFNGPAMLLFLKEIIKRVKKKVLIIWDGAKIHMCEVVKKFLTEQKPDKIWLVKTPPYSPELNPAEQIWWYIKQEFVCKSFENINELGKYLAKQVKNLINKQTVKSICSYKYLQCTF